MKKIICILLLGNVWACSSKEQAYSKTAFYFDTSVTITIYHKNGEALLEQSMDLCEQMELIFSRTNENSELYKVNHRTSNTLEISNDLATVIQTGLEAYSLSDGHFDISVAPVLELWDFTSENPIIPKQDSIQKALQYVNSDSIILENTTLSFSNDYTQIDLGALAKGYIADTLKSFLIENGVESGYLNIGGNVLCIGSKPDESAWNIGIQKPFGKQGETIYIAKIKDSSVVSSGTYERGFEKDGIRYHHLLDAKNGMPMNNDLVHVTIFCKNSLQADMLSSSVFLMGLEKGKNYIENTEDVEAIFVDTNGNIYYTSGLE